MTATALIVAVCAMAVASSFFPQIPGDLDPSQKAAWADAAWSRYGSSAVWLARLGVFNFATSVPFTCAAFALTGASTVCLVNRWRRLWRDTRDLALPPPAFKARNNRSYTLPSGTTLAVASAVFCESLEDRGYQVRAETVRESVWVRADRRGWARLGTLATHLAVPAMAVAVLLSSILATRQSVRVGPNSTASVGPHSDAMVRNDGFAVLTEPDGVPRSYEARLTLIKEAVEVRTALLGLNQSMKVDRYSVYLSSYWGPPGAYGVTLTAVHDPGYPAFVISGLLLIGGVVASLYLRPATVVACLGGTDLVIIPIASRSGSGSWEDIEYALGALGIHSRRDERLMKPADSQ
ncbi:MAG: cytochrome c biogenesis protein ResB [Anaerolineae bacterium]